MCGIVGYIGREAAAPILLDGLQRLEYRGYDSAGIAVHSEQNGLQIVKTKGRLQALVDIVSAGKPLTGTMGIGHTRWATHGEPSDENSHPHVSEDGRIAVVHNGIIENYIQIKEFLQGKGVQFRSQTDTEVIAHLLEYYYDGDIQHYASRYFNHESIFFIGRNLDYALSLEGSLKLKEISYIHSEAYAAGELKHGTISLIVPGTLVVAVGTYGKLFDKAMSNVIEVKARGADVLALTTEDRAPEMAKYVDAVLTVPSAGDLFLPNLGVVPLQLFAYYVALHRGCDIDKPRNLAKSVTVE